MGVARRAAGAAARLATFGRIGLAVALLAGLWFGTVTGVERASRGADDRRATDRSAVATAFANSVRDWLDAASVEATTLSRLVATVPAPSMPGVIQSFLDDRRTFSRSAIVFSGPTVVGASPDASELVGLVPRPCTRTDEAGVGVSDATLGELVASASSADEPTVSRIFEVPGDCREVVAAAVPSGGYVTVVLGDVTDLSARLFAGSLITEAISLSPPSGPNALHPGGTRLLVITGDVALEPRLGVISVPPRVATFAKSASGGSDKRTRYSMGDEGDAEVLGVYTSIQNGWSLVLEQDAAVFDIELQSRPSVIVATVLTVVFAFVFALVAYFDIRRRRVARRTEVAKNAFFSIAGHELRTPLTVIKGFAEALTDNWDDLDDTRRKALVERITPQTRRLDRLVERLLVAASIQAETHTRPQVRGIDAMSVLAQLAERFRTEAPLHEFIVAAEPGLPDVIADPIALDQVFEHLVDNAVKYSPKGGRVVISAVRAGKTVEMSVEDEGVGLPSQHEHIFDKFVQGESVTKRVHDEGGVGLGLYIVRTLVEDMAGRVRAESRSRDGSVSGARFVVSLRTAPGRPVDEAPPAPAADLHDARRG